MFYRAFKLKRVLCNLAEVCQFHQNEGQIVLGMVKEKVSGAKVRVLTTAPKLGFKPLVMLLFGDRIFASGALPQQTLLLFLRSDFQCIGKPVLAGFISSVAPAHFAHLPGTQCCFSGYCEPIVYVQQELAQAFAFLLLPPL